MADKKISALTAATTPLAGTEVFPIVQSSTTVKATIASVQAAPVAAGTANGVQYLDGSKVPTTGTALAFTGTTLDVSGSGAIGVTASSSADIAKLVTSAPQSKQAQVLWQEAGSNKWNVYKDSNSTADLVFYGGAETLRLGQTTGNVTVSTGNLVISTSGKGIDFSATSGTGTSELLADYEEGTFTPVVSGSTTAGTGTYTARNGVYTKIGNAVYFQIDYILSAHTGTGDTLITGLPFTSGNAYYTNIVVTAQNLALTALYYIGGSIIAPTSTTMYFQQMPVGGGSAIGIPIDPVCDVRLSGFYFV